MGLWIDVAIMEDSMQVSLNLNQNYNGIQEFRSWVCIKENKSTNLKRILHLNDQSSIIYNGQGMEAV